MSSAMIRAILEGRKSQTRRVLKPQPTCLHDGEPYWNIGGYRAWSYRGVTDPLRKGTVNPLDCPHGQAGDRLWVRETWAETESDGGPVIVYRAGGYRVHGATGDWNLGTWKDEVFEGEVGQIYPPDKWRPSIFMPRWASRITLEITGVRVERVQEIGEKDAKAEGCEPITCSAESIIFGTWKARFRWRDGFKVLWNSINAKRGFGWDVNPWVWVISFKRVEA